MSSRLHTRINQYPIEKGIEFNYDISGNPFIETGSLPQSSSSDWIRNTNHGNPNYDGPGGGAGSLYFYCDTARRDRFSINSGNWGSALLDNDYSIGIWFKIGQSTYAEGGLTPILAVATPSTGGFAFNIVTNATGFPVNTAVMINYGNDVYVFKDPDNMGFESIQFDKWYYLAVVKNGTTGDFYLNGVKQATVTMTTGSPSTVNFGNASLSGSAPIRTNYYISNFYVATTSVINANEITEIWNAGKTITAPVKYWNGSAWITSNGIKRWDGHIWHEVNAQKRDPSNTSWVTI